MTEEGLASVPRDKRPTLEDLEGYTESRYPAGTDYSAYREELMVWLSDYRRDEEENRERNNEHPDSTPLYVEDARIGNPRSGYDPASFNLAEARSTIESRPLH